MKAELEYVSDRYRKVAVYLDKPGEWVVYAHMPVWLYDIVDYRPAGKHITYRHGETEGVVGYHEEETGTKIMTNETYNMRLDIYKDVETVTPELVDQWLDEEYADAIEHDGDLGFHKIVGVK